MITVSKYLEAVQFQIVKRSCRETETGYRCPRQHQSETIIQKRTQCRTGRSIQARKDLRARQDSCHQIFERRKKGRLNSEERGFLGERRIEVRRVQSVMSASSLEHCYWEMHSASCVGFQIWKLMFLARVALNQQQYLICLFISLIRLTVLILYADLCSYFHLFSASVSLKQIDR